MAASIAPPLIDGLDAVIDDRVLVFGTLPPAGRDVDLLARPRELAAMAEWLAERGYVRRGNQWRSLSNDQSVELVPASAWRLPSAEVQRLFEEGEPLPGARHLVRPAPHHALLIAARRAARDPGMLDDRRRCRLREELEREPGAWRRAEEVASVWGARAALQFLRAAHGGAATRGLRVHREWLRLALARPEARGATMRRALRRGRPGGIVAFSGIDGSGKSSQASALRDGLEGLGVQAEVVWSPSQNLLFRLPTSVKRPLRRLLSRLGESPDSSASHSAPVPSAGVGPAFASLPRQRAPITHVLATVVAVVLAISLRRAASRRRTRGRVVIVDRYTLDATVYVRQRWGEGRPLRFQCWIVRKLARRPLAAYWLDLPPERAFARKQDYPLDTLRERVGLYEEHAGALGVRRLDGQRPREELAEEILRDVWSRLS